MAEHPISPTQPASASVLAQVLVMTENMLSMAHNGSWEEVTELEAQRREALATIFSSPVPSAQAELFSEALAAMLCMNEELIGLLELAKENVAIKRTDQKYINKSLNCYLDVTENH